MPKFQAYWCEKGKELDVRVTLAKIREYDATEKALLKAPLATDGDILQAQADWVAGLLKAHIDGVLLLVELSREEIQDAFAQLYRGAKAKNAEGPRPLETPSA